jgi:hypothetical protein
MHTAPRFLLGVRYLRKSSYYEDQGVVAAIQGLENPSQDPVVGSQAVAHGVIVRTAVGRNDMRCEVRGLASSPEVVLVVCDAIQEECIESVVASFHDRSEHVRQVLVEKRRQPPRAVRFDLLPGDLASDRREKGNRHT